MQQHSDAIIQQRRSNLNNDQDQSEQTNASILTQTVASSVGNFVSYFQLIFANEYQFITSLLRF